MPVLNIGGRRVTVDDTFLKLSPEEQNETVDEIAESLGIKGDADPEEGSGIAMNTTAGLNEAIYGAAGAPVDLARGAMNLGIRGFNAATGSDVGMIPSDSLGGSEWIADTMGAAHPALDPANTKAVTAEERIARGVGEGVGYAVAPEAAVGAMVRGGQLAGRAAETAGRAFGRGDDLAAAAANAAVGGASGAGAQGAMEAAPDEWDAVAGLAGGLAAGGAAAVATAAPSAVRAAGRFADDATAPMREAGRERLASERLRDAATDPNAVREALDAGVQEIVPGSAPTTAQAVGDMGLLGLERTMQTKNGEAFAQRRADQNAARVGALEGVQAEGAPEAVAAALRQRFQAIDDETQAAIDAARGQGDAAVGGATRAAQDGAGALGTGATPDVAGDRMRGALESARTQAKAKERALWDVVDPDGTLVTGTDNMRTAAKGIVDEIPDTAEPLSTKEALIYDTIGDLGESASFKRVEGLRRRLNDALKEERREKGETEMYRRLSIMRGALEQDLDGAIVQKVGQQADAVARGEMQVEDTIEAAWLRQREEWFAERRAAEAATARAAGGEASASSGTAGGIRSTSVSPASGGNGQAGGRLSNASGDPGLPANDLEPNFDEAARDRLKAATTATRERAETFDNKTLGPLRARPSTTAPYDVGSSSVPGTIFKPGAKGFDSVETYRRAVGDDPEAMGAIRDFAVDRLQKVAGRPDGTLDPSKARTWVSMHKDALRAFPELDAQIRRAADSSDVMAGADTARAAAVKTAEAARASAMADVDRGNLGKLRAETDRTEIGKLVGKAFDATASAQEVLKLKMAIGKDPAAREGLKRAVVDEMTRRFVGTGEAGVSGVGTLKSDGFQQFVRKNKAALKGAGFDDEQVEIFDRIAADLQQANRSIVAVRAPGDSNTADKLLKVQATDKPGSILMKTIAGIAAGGGTGLAVGGSFGAAVGAAVAPVIAAARQAGLKTVDDIVADALLNPERARLLLSKATNKGERDTVARLAKLYRNAAIASSAVVLDEDEPAAPADASRRVPAPADRERADSPRLTPDDRASPIPSDLIDDGKAVMDGERSVPIPTPAERGKPGEGEEKWNRFPSQSGTLNVPRAEMPQIKSEHRGALVNFLAARGIKHTDVTVPASALKATQAEFSPERVESAKARTGGDRAILVSSDWQVVDGHHQWLAKKEAGDDVRVIRLNAPISELLDVVREFPSAETEAAATPKSKMAELEERAVARRAARSAA